MKDWKDEEKEGKETKPAGRQGCWRGRKLKTGIGEKVRREQKWERKDGEEKGKKDKPRGRNGGSVGLRLKTGIEGKGEDKLIWLSRPHKALSRQDTKVDLALSPGRPQGQVTFFVGLSGALRDASGRSVTFPLDEAASRGGCRAHISFPHPRGSSFSTLCLSSFSS